MSPYIDWSDPEGLFDMLVEYVGDEKIGAHHDSQREQFLGQLLSRLWVAQESSTELPEIMVQLKRIIGSVNPEFQQDPVMDHLSACLEELERISDQT